MKTTAATTEEVEIPMFTEHRSLSGHTIKIINFDNPKACPRTGKIELIYIQRKFDHTGKPVGDPNTSFKCFRDHNTDITYGIPLGTDPKTGEINWMRIVLRDFRIYDLTKLQDAKEWACVRMWHTVQGSPLQSGKPFFKVLDHEEAAQKQIIAVEHTERAINLAKKIVGNEIVEFARVLEIPNIETDTVAIIKGKIFEKALKSPEWFCKKYDDANRKVLTVLNRCLVNNLIVFDPMHGYSTKTGLFLGDNEFAAINYLTKNSAMLVSLDSESKKMDKFYQENPESSTSLFPQENPLETDEQREINTLKKRLEQSDKLASELNTKFMQLMEMKGAENKVALPKTPNFGPEAPSEETVRAEAKVLGIGNWHNKKVENLILEIQELKANLTT